MRKQLLVLAVSALLASACKKSPAPEQQPTAGQQAAAGQQAGDASATPSAGATEPSSPMAYVTTVTVLKVEAVDAGKIKNAEGKDVSNFRALLYRGEQVAVVETKDDWVRVRSSDEKEGWLKRSWVLESAGVTEATVTNAAVKMFDRPDLLASNATKKLVPGTYLLVVKEKAPFSQVNHMGSQSTWVLTDQLTTDAKEVAAAKLIEKARYLAKQPNKKEEAIATLDIIRTVAPESALLEVLATELGVATAAASEGATEPAAQPTSADDPLSPGAAANQ